MEEECKITLNTGLRGVTIANTRICEVDGKNGRLVYRGYMIQDLAKASYEEVAYLLLYEHLPAAEELKGFRTQLAAERGIPPELIAALKTRPPKALPMDVLQAAVPMLAHHDPDIAEYTREAALRMAHRLIAKFPTVVAAWHRIRSGKDPVTPSPDLGHAANFLYMLNGRTPDETATRAIDTALVLHAEHAFNASTFAAREVASTQAHMYAAVAAGVGSLSGALHGGANAKVMQMLLKLGSADKVADFVNAELDAGRKIFGLGHAVYDVDDPRAHIIASMSKALGEGARQPAVVRDVDPDRADRQGDLPHAQKRGHPRKCRFLQCFPVLLPRDSGRSVHAGVRHRPRGRLGGAHHRRAVWGGRGQTRALPPGIRLHRGLLRTRCVRVRAS